MNIWRLHFLNIKKCTARMTWWAKHKNSIAYGNKGNLHWWHFVKSISRMRMTTGNCVKRTWMWHNCERQYFVDKCADFLLQIKIAMASTQNDVTKFCNRPKDSIRCACHAKWCKHSMFEHFMNVSRAWWC